jgi:hypothetical protein
MPIAGRPRFLTHAVSFVRQADTKVVYKPHRHFFVGQNVMFRKFARQPPCFAPKKARAGATSNPLEHEHDHRDCKRICLSRFFEITQRLPPASHGTRSYFAESWLKETHPIGDSAAYDQNSLYLISSSDEIRLRKRLQCPPVGIGFGVLSNAWNSCSTPQAPGSGSSGSRDFMNNAVQKILDVQSAGSSKAPQQYISQSCA